MQALSVLLLLATAAVLGDTAVNRTCTQLVNVVKSQCNRCSGPGIVAIDIGSDELETICEGVGGDPECAGDLSDCQHDRDTLQFKLGACTDDKSAVEDDLTTCTDGYTTCNATITAIESDYTACTDSLDTCNGDKATCASSLSSCTTARDTAQASLNTLNTFNENMETYYQNLQADFSNVGDICVNFDTNELDLLCVLSYISSIAQPVTEGVYGPPFETVSVFNCKLNILACKIQCLAGSYWNVYTPGTTTGCLDQYGRIGMACNACFNDCKTETSITCQ